MTVELLIEKNNSKEVIYKKTVPVVAINGALTPEVPLEDAIFYDLWLPDGATIYAKVDLGNFGIRKARMGKDIPIIMNGETLTIVWPKNLVEL